MTLQGRLVDCAARLREGRYANEQSISQGVVLPVLRELSWDDSDTEVVYPEFGTGEGRVDFALCDPPCKPRCFVEVKQPGKVEDGVRQALEYAFHTGVQFVVLTDGVTWSFYLPAEQGSYEDRRVFKLDLLGREPKESAEVLARYLQHGRVLSGESLETARTEYRSKSRRERARRDIPAAWAELVQKGDDLLVDLIAEAVESKSGVRPDDSDISAFLGNLALGHPHDTVVPSAPPSTPPPKTTGTATAISTQRRSGRSRGQLTIRAESFAYSTGVDALVTVLNNLAEDDPTFLERCSRHPAFFGRKRRFIARQPEELYPGRQDLQRHSAILKDGWLVGTNNNTATKQSLIKAAAEVAGLKFGKDVIVDL